MLKYSAELQKEGNLHYQQEYKIPICGSSLDFLLYQPETAQILHILYMLVKNKFCFLLVQQQVLCTVKMEKY